MGTAPAELLRTAREAAGLSRSALASKAGVPTTTVSRIETARSDPSVGTLARLLAAANAELLLDSRPRSDASPTLASLATAVVARSPRLRIDWTRLRAFADWAQENPDEVADAIADPPARTGTPLDAILAGFAEQLAARAHTEVPRWTRSVPSPAEPWAPPGTPAMRARAERETPEEFRRRGIVLSPDALFRDAA